MTRVELEHRAIRASIYPTLSARQESYATAMCERADLLEKLIADTKREQQR